MRYNLFVLIIIYFFIMTQPLYVMEEKTINTSFKGLIYLFKNNVFDCRDMIIYNNKNKKEYKTIEGLDAPVDFIVHPSKKKIAFFYNNSVKVYDIKKNCIIKSFESTNQWCTYRSVEFNFFNKDILLKLFDAKNKKSFVNIYNFDTNIYYDIKNLQRYSGATHFLLHPQKSILCIIESGYLQTFNYKQWDNVQLTQQNLKYIPNKCVVDHEKFVALRHSNNLTVSIINLDNLADQSLYIKSESDKEFLSVLFYPKKSILVTITRTTSLVPAKTFIQYWNILNRECIESVELTSRDYGCKFYFSRNGKKIFIYSTDGSLYKYQVPWQKLNYACKRDKLLCLWFIAKKIYLMPDDVTRIVMRLINNLSD